MYTRYKRIAKPNNPSLDMENKGLLGITCDVGHFPTNATNALHLCCQVRRFRTRFISCPQTTTIIVTTLRLTTRL